MKRKITFLVVAVLCLQTLLAQNKTIRGTIVDSFSEPIIGASAHVKGTYTGTISDLNGNYTLENVPEDAVITFSYIGMIAIAKAVLSALAHKNSIVFASTHDVELASLLENEYESFHFCECVADNTLSFDYKLKPGPATERNAIRIIEMCGYPKEVVGEAYRLAKKHVL